MRRYRATAVSTPRCAAATIEHMRPDPEPIGTFPPVRLPDVLDDVEHDTDEDREALLVGFLSAAWPTTRAQYQ